MDKKFLILYLGLITCIYVKAQTNSTEQVSSLIVALDSRSNVNSLWNPSKISTILTAILSESEVTPNYTSGIIYGIKDGALTPDNFSRLISKPEKLSNGYTGFLKNLYSNLPQGSYYSITSFAKPYSLIALKDCQLTNRTFMAIITDGKYNGNDDYYGEVTYVKNNFTTEGNNKFKINIQNVQTNYFCKFLNEKRIDGGYIQLYEFIPLQQYFSLESVLDFPHKIIANRSKTGYVINVPILNLENKDYDIQKIEISIKVDDKEKETLFIKPGEEIGLSLNKYEADNAVIEIRSWIKLCDGIYNNTVLHPYGSKLQGSQGLIRQISIQKEPDSQILGTFALPDFLFAVSFWTSSQSVAAMSWGWIFIIIVLIVILIIIAKNNLYKVDPTKIQI